MSKRRRRHRRHQRRRFFLGFSLMSILLVIAVLGTAALAIATTIGGVSPPHLGSMTSAVTGYALEPSQCKTYITNPTAVVIVHTNEAGTAASEIVIGDRTRAHASINGGGGNDCVLAALDGFADTTSGGTGTDVCMGGHNEDSYTNDCEYAYPWP